MTDVFDEIEKEYRLKDLKRKELVYDEIDQLAAAVLNSGKKEEMMFSKIGIKMRLTIERLDD